MNEEASHLPRDNLPSVKPGERRRFLTAELSEQEAERIASSRMDSSHDHLNALLDGDMEFEALKESET
jgi:hypothetical protein